MYSVYTMTYSNLLCLTLFYILQFSSDYLPINPKPTLSTFLDEETIESTGITHNFQQSFDKLFPYLYHQMSNTVHMSTLDLIDGISRHLINNQFSNYKQHLLYTCKLYQ